MSPMSSIPIPDTIVPSLTRSFTRSPHYTHCDTLRNLWHFGPIKNSSLILGWLWRSLKQGQECRGFTAFAKCRPNLTHIIDPTGLRRTIIRSATMAPSASSCRCTNARAVFKTPVVSHGSIQQEQGNKWTSSLVLSELDVMHVLFMQLISYMF